MALRSASDNDVLTTVVADLGRAVDEADDGRWAPSLVAEIRCMVSYPTGLTVFF